MTSVDLLISNSALKRCNKYIFVSMAGRINRLRRGKFSFISFSEDLCQSKQMTTKNPWNHFMLLHCPHNHFNFSRATEPWTPRVLFLESNFSSEPRLFLLICNSILSSHLMSTSAKHGWLEASNKFMFTQQTARKLFLLRPKLNRT